MRELVKQKAEVVVSSQFSSLSPPASKESTSITTYTEEKLTKQTPYLYSVQIHWFSSAFTTVSGFTSTWKLETCLQHKFHHSDHHCTSDQLLLHGKAVCDSWLEKLCSASQINRADDSNFLNLYTGALCYWQHDDDVSCCILWTMSLSRLPFNVFLVFLFHPLEPFSLLLGLVKWVKCFTSCSIDFYEILILLFKFPWMMKLKLSKDAFDCITF